MEPALGMPAAAAALRELLHDLIAVHRLLGEEAEDGVADDAAPHLEATAVRAAVAVAADPAAEAAHPAAAGSLDREGVVGVGMEGRSAVMAGPPGVVVDHWMFLAWVGWC